MGGAILQCQQAAQLCLFKVKLKEWWTLGSRLGPEFVAMVSGLLSFPSLPGQSISLVAFDKSERKILPSFSISPTWAVATNFTVFPQSDDRLPQFHFWVWCPQLLPISYLCQCRIVYFYLKFLETRKRNLGLFLQITAPTALWMAS